MKPYLRCMGYRRRQLLNTCLDAPLSCTQYIFDCPLHLLYSLYSFGDAFFAGFLGCVLNLSGHSEDIQKDAPNIDPLLKALTKARAKYWQSFVPFYLFLVTVGGYGDLTWS